MSTSTVTAPNAVATGVWAQTWHQTWTAHVAADNPRRLDPNEQAVFSARATFYEALVNYANVPGFATGTHVEVFGRPLAGFQWRGWTPAHHEHLHVYEHPALGLWGQVALNTWHVQSGDGFYTAQRDMPFDELDHRARLDTLKDARDGHLTARSYAALLREPLERLRANAVTHSTFSNETHHGRAVALTAFADTDEDRAEALLATLALHDLTN